MQNNSRVPRRVSIVQQQEVKRDPIVSGEKIQIGFDLNAVRESRTFQAAVRAKTAEDSVNYFGDRFSSASHILCLHLRPSSWMYIFYTHTQKRFFIYQTTDFCSVKFTKFQ